MTELGYTNWIRFLVWLLVGMVIYIHYGYEHSALGGNVTRAHKIAVKIADIGAAIGLIAGIVIFWGNSILAVILIAAVTAALTFVATYLVAALFLKLTAKAG
jgi:APA family basic amino acid/polyamine antiporter